MLYTHIYTNAHTLLLEEAIVVSSIGQSYKETPLSVSRQTEVALDPAR